MPRKQGRRNAANYEQPAVFLLISLMTITTNQPLFGEKNSVIVVMDSRLKLRVRYENNKLKFHMECSETLLDK